MPPFLLLSLVALTSVAVGALVGGWWVHLRCQARLADAAERDAVTGLVRQRAWLESVNRYRALAERMGYPLTVMFIEVDNREQLLARLPVASQNAIEKAFATQMLERIRAYDQLGIWARFQYLLMLPHADISNALVLVDDLRQTVARLPPLSVGGADALTISIGLHCVAPERARGAQADAGMLVAAARRALDATAAEGPNRIEVEP